MELGVHKGSDGSAMFEMGNTKVWVACRGPLESKNVIGVSVDLSFASFSTMERKTNRQDRRTREIAQQVERALAGVVDPSSFPRSRIDLVVRVIQADGGVPWVSFNACILALMDAGVPMRDFCVACGVGFVDRVLLVDPSSSEMAALGGNTASGELWLVLAPRLSKLVSFSLNGRVSEAILDDLFQTAENGANQLVQHMKTMVTSHYSSLEPHGILDHDDDEDMDSGE